MGDEMELVFKTMFPADEPGDFGEVSNPVAESFQAAEYGELAKNDGWSWNEPFETAAAPKPEEKFAKGYCPQFTPAMQAAVVRAADELDFSGDEEDFQKRVTERAKEILEEGVTI